MPPPTIRRLFTAAVVALAITGHAQTINDGARTSAVTGQVADVSTTAAGLLMGASEANPLGLATLGLKYIAYQRIQAAPPEQQPRLWQQYGAFGWGAAANNLCILVGIASGGAGGALCPLLGLGVGASLLAQSPPLTPAQEEREAFMNYCQSARTQRPEMQCIYIPPRG